MSFFDPERLPSEVILYITDRLTSLRDLSALALTNHAFDALLSPVLCRHGMRLDTELFLRACGQGGSRTGTVARLLAAGADPSIQHLTANSLRYTGIVGHGELNTPAHFDTTLLQYGRSLQYPDNLERPVEQEGWELGAREDAICVRACTPEKLREIIVEASREPDLWHVSWSAIHVAAVRGHIGVLKLLLAHQKDLANSLAPGYGKIDRHEPSMGLRGRYIHMDEDSVTSHLESQPQTKHWSMHTPLRAALCARQEDAARCLIDHDAALEFRHIEHGKHYEHALHMAARHGCVDVINHLCSQRKLMDINVTDSDGWTPLCQAIVSPIRNVDTITTLLSHGADINASLPNNNGMTHLHLACWQRDWHRALLLLRGGADVHAIWRPDPITWPPHPEYNSYGPWRAIDLVCMETFTKAPQSVRTYFNRTDELGDGRRVELLRRLIQDHGADTGPCPGSQHSALAIAATNPGNPQQFEIGALELLNAMRDAGVFFHNDHTIIAKAFMSPQGLHVRNRRPTEKTTIDVITWLARHGAPVPPESNEIVFAGIMRAVERAKNREDDQIYLLRDLAEMVKMLVKRGGMDPHITSVQHAVAKDGPCPLFQAMRSTQDLLTHKIMGRVMGDLGARPPELLIALRGFRELLPVMKQWEVADFMASEEEKSHEDRSDLELETDETHEDLSRAELAREPPSVDMEMDVSGEEQRGDEEAWNIDRPKDHGHFAPSPHEQEDSEECGWNDRETNEDEDDNDANDEEPEDLDDNASITSSTLLRQWQQAKEDAEKEYRGRHHMNVILEDLKVLFCHTMKHVLRDPFDTTIPSSANIVKTIFESSAGGLPDTASSGRARREIEYYRTLATRHIRQFLEDYSSKTKGDLTDENLTAFIDYTRYADYLALCRDRKSA